MKPPKKIYCRKTDHMTHNFSAIPATRCRVEDDDLCYYLQNSEIEKLGRWINKNYPCKNGQCQEILEKIENMKEGK